MMCRLPAPFACDPPRLLQPLYLESIWRGRRTPEVSWSKPSGRARTRTRLGSCQNPQPLSASIVRFLRTLFTSRPLLFSFASLFKHHPSRCLALWLPGTFSDRGRCGLLKCRPSLRGNHHFLRPGLATSTSRFSLRRSCLGLESLSWSAICWRHQYQAQTEMERQVQDDQRSPTHMSDDMSNTLHPSSHSTSPPHGHGSDGHGGIGHDFHRPERRVPNYAAPTSYSPPSYAYSQQHVHDHDPATLNFPQAPSTELAPLQLNAQEHNVNYLPPLASLTSPSSASSGHGGLSSTTRDTSSYSPPPRPPLWPSGNPYSAYYNAHSGQSADSPAGADPDAMCIGAREPLRRENRGNQASSVSLDDPDVRVAAEALGDLKTSSKFGDPLLFALWAEVASMERTEDGLEFADRMALDQILFPRPGTELRISHHTA